jgi:thioredoxin 1
MKELNGEQVEQLKKEGKKIILDFYALWCGPCKTLIPRLESMSTEYDDVEFVKIDVDKNQEYAISLGIRSIPTVIIYNGDNLIDRSQGVQTESYYKDFLNNL